MPGQERGTVVNDSEISERLRVSCTLSGMRYRGKVIAPHSCSVMKLCKNGRSVFAACKFHSVQTFTSDPVYVSEFIAELERKNNG